VALLGAVACICAASAPRADAGTYVVHQCRTPTGAPAPIAGWDYVVYASSIDHWGDSCPRGGLRLTLDPNKVHPKDDVLTAWYPAPDNTKIVHYTFWRTVAVGKGSHYFSVPIERYNGTEQWMGKSCRGDTCSGLGDLRNPLSDVNRIDGAPKQPIDAVGYYLSCGYYADDEPDCTSATPAMEVVISRAEITLADDEAPVIAAPPSGGLVTTSTTLTGAQSVGIQATDKGSGVADVGIEVDGKVVSHGPLGTPGPKCAQPYVTSVPCPLTAGGAVTLDTGTLPDGDHRLRLLVSDAAGNLRPWGPITIRTSNTPPDTSCVPDPPVLGSNALRAGLMPVPLKKAKPKPATRTLRVGYGRSTQLTGTLRNDDGTPLPGAALCVVYRLDGEAGAYRELARISSGPDGGFAVPVPKGPSRELLVIYRVGAGAVLSSTRLLVVPRVRVSLHRRVVRNGHRMILTGQLGGGPFPRRGVRLNMQVVKDDRWSGFGDPFRTDSRGRFRFTYRFLHTTSTQRYRLRLRAYAQAGYPYVTGYSRRITVRVKP
jgi:hypothetical protein